MAVDKKRFSDWHQLHEDSEQLVLDLNYLHDCRQAIRGCDRVYNLAADMGGIGYITQHYADCMMSVLITAHMIKVAHENGVQKYLGASSACVYPDYRQDELDQPALKESDAFPASPEAGYGEEKLFGERLAQIFHHDYGMQVRIPRFHNVYGPYGEFVGGREKAPAALCRKIALAKLQGTDSIDIWGDGEQTRSFMYVDDAVEGMIRLMASDCNEPINLGSTELVSINQLVDIIEEIADVSVQRRYDPSKPQGVRGRNSDNTMIREVLNWEPSISLRTGLASTYAWIESIL